MTEETNTEYILKFSIAEINNIISGLQELPTKVAVPIINKIHQQYNQQVLQKDT